MKFISSVDAVAKTPHTMFSYRDAIVRLIDFSKIQNGIIQVVAGLGRFHNAEQATCRSSP